MRLPVRLGDIERQGKILIIVDAINIVKNLLVITYKTGNRKAEVAELNLVYQSLIQLVGETQVSLIELAKESRRTLSRLERQNTAQLKSDQPNQNNNEMKEHRQLQHVDMIFRFYLPLLSLITQTQNMSDLQAEIKKLLLDEHAASFVRNLMRDLPVLNSKGKKIEKHATFSQIVATFIQKPTDIENNKALLRMEQSLELTMNKIVEQVKPDLEN